MQSGLCNTWATCLGQETHQKMRWRTWTFFTTTYRTRTTKYNRLVHKFRQRSTRLCVGTKVYQNQWNNAMQRPLRRSGSFKVTDFGTNRKLIYDFLLVMSRLLINLPLTRFPSYGWLLFKFSLARGECLNLTLSRGWPPANIAINDISLQTRFFGLHFCCRKYWCIFNHFYAIRPESYRIHWNYAPAVDGHPRSPSLVPIESSYAISC